MRSKHLVEGIHETPINASCIGGGPFMRLTGVLELVSQYVTGSSNGGVRMQP